jgi:hypothetical protein
MKQLVLLLFVSALFSPAFCQQDSLLKTFKFRSVNYRAISFNIGAGSQYQRNALYSGYSTYSSAGGNFNTNYYALKSTERILFTATAGLGTGFSSNNAKNTFSTSKARNFSLAPTVNVLNKWFAKNNFAELGIIAGTNIYNTKYTNEPNVSGNGKNMLSQYSVALNTGIGKGRLENVTDMQNALWLTKALKKANSLTHSLTIPELNELGRSITKANNTRILDTRKRTQFILETVDDFFQQKGLINKTDITYFSNLNDILFFAFNTPRLSGTEKFIRLTPSITGYNGDSRQNNYTTRHKETSRVKAATFSTGFNKYAPASLVHQNNFGVALQLYYATLDYEDRYYTADILTSEIKTKPELKQASLNVFMEHGIYPNTRTIINFNLQALGGYQDVNQQTNWFSKINGSATCDYFISYRTKLQVSVGGIYYKNFYAIDRYLNQFTDNFMLFSNVGLNISI